MSIDDLIRTTLSSSGWDKQDAEALIAVTKLKHFNQIWLAAAVLSANAKMMNRDPEELYHTLREIQEEMHEDRHENIEALN